MPRWRDEEEIDEALTDRETARSARRDRDLSAPARAGMRTGLAKGFKQIADAQVKRALPRKRGAGNKPKRKNAP
jgi:hypothetical protein